MSYEMLLSPMSIGTMTVKNRTVMTAAEVSMGQTNGKPTEKIMDYYEERAKGGVGLIIPGVTRVNDTRGTFSFTQLAMSHDYHIEPMREFASRLHKHGAKLAIQLHHPGRQGYGSALNSLPLVIPITNINPDFAKVMFKAAPLMMNLEHNHGISQSVQAPSKVECSYHGGARMHAMSKREIKKLQNDFIEAAVRCKKAGVDAVELHAGHGYLIQQFLSPNTNRRTDEYGGSFENRLRFIAEIIAGIREKCGSDYPLLVRLTIDEFYEKIGKPGKGYTVETGVKIAKRLEELGVDAIDVTSACYDAFNYWAEPTSFKEGWRAYLAKAVKEAVSIPVIAANVIRSPEQAERQLQEGYQDFMGSARDFICDPHWVKKVEEGRTNEIRRCIGCCNCLSKLMENGPKGKATYCALNMAVGREKEYNNMPQDGNGRPVVVVGAGPAGLTAAQALAMRGFKVTVVEKSEKPGGQVITAASCHLKEKLSWSIEDLMTNAAKAGAEIRLGTELTAQQIADMKPYAVVIAAGGTPIRPKSIPGIDLETVCLAPEIIMGEKKIQNKKVTVVGSGITGLEVTEFLNEEGCEVTVIEMADEVAPGAWFQLVDDEMERIKPYGTKFLTGTKLVGIEPGKVLTENAKTGEKGVIEADNVVLSLGVRPVNDLVKELEACGVRNVVAVGDASKSGTIADACHNAFDTVMNIK